MSTQQVDRLQSLLAKVQQNRGNARTANARAAVPAAAPVSPARAAAAAAPPAAAKKAAPSAQAPTTPVGMQAPPPARRAPAAEEDFDFSSLPPPGATRAAAAAAAAQEPAFTPAERRTRPGATPLELAVEDTLDRPAVSPITTPQQPPARAAAAPAPAAAAPAAARRDGVVLADPTPGTPNRPIAQVLSKQPPVTPTSFGDLLKRSLSLRPR